MVSFLTRTLSPNIPLKIHLIFPIAIMEYRPPVHISPLLTFSPEMCSGNGPRNEKRESAGIAAGGRFGKRTPAHAGLILVVPTG